MHSNLTLSETISNWLDLHLPFDLEYLPEGSYLVGGTVRDILLHREREYLDLDFIVPTKTIEIAQNLAKTYHAGFVILDQQRHIARVVFPQITCDFAEQEGETVEVDLQRRDFTINAIAYCLKQGKICDPTKGLKDINKRTIRMISVGNLKDDPVRLLRAYRQAAQLNLTIENDTRDTLRLLSGELKKVAGERIKNELNYILSSAESSYWLEMAWQDNILSDWLPSATDEKVALFAEIDHFGKVISDQFNADIFYSITLAKLALLLSCSVEKAESELINLKTSRCDIRLITVALDKLKSLKNFSKPLTIKEQYFLFLESKDSFVILALLYLVSQQPDWEIMSLLKRYFDPKDPIAHPKPLIKGNDLLSELQLSPGPIIGKLLSEIQVAHLEGKIQSKEESIIWSREFLKNQKNRLKS